MKKSKLLILCVIALMLAGGLALVSCDTEKCTGSGECIITIAQGTSGLYVDTEAERSSCGVTKNSEGKGGCQVANMNSIWWQNETMKYGTHKCNC
jgi:hypothetical protein